MSGREKLEHRLARTSPALRRILERALEGRPPSWEDGVVLSGARGAELEALAMTADALRRIEAGDTVTYVVNRNVNFTNVCVKSCRFCAFARGVRSEEGYFLPVEEVVRRVLDARELGATEVCIQAGLAPTATAATYIDLCRAVRRAAPDVHIHAFSPEEVAYAARLGRMPLRALLLELREAGLGSLPGTSAEILDDSLRKRIAPTRISTAEWIEVITTAHSLGIPTTSTMMFGHVETAAHRMRHLDLLRSIQAETGGFTEFVPLSFVHTESPLFSRAEVEGVSPGPTGDDVVRLYAIARLMLGPSFRNIQASWVKEGISRAQLLLDAGVNDLGGTLMNESISTAAGASHGQLVTPARLHELIRGAGRIPAERSTRYEILREFGALAARDEGHPLDAITDPDEAFGSYAELSTDARFRYAGRRARALPAAE